MAADPTDCTTLLIQKLYVVERQGDHCRENIKCRGCFSESCVPIH